jgi:hypothetical protein
MIIVVEPDASPEPARKRKSTAASVALDGVTL